MNNLRVLVTGSTGFIGKELVDHLVNCNFQVIAAVRKNSPLLPIDIKQAVVGNLLPGTDWNNALTNINVVIHLSARVHVMNESAANPLEQFRKTNTVSTLNLARQAASNGASRFIYLSSIKVNGESSNIDTPFRADDINLPTDPYGLSKYEAEQGLKDISAETGMDVVIIRPPLVYGPNVKANFNSMMSWLYRGVPLPFGAVSNNRRSLVSLDNLIDLIVTCISHPAAANQTFLVSDDEDLSTTELLQRLSSALGKTPRLLPLPVKFLEIGSSLVGKKDMLSRLCGSLQVDIAYTKNTLDWKPPISVDIGLQKSADAFLKHQKK